MDTVYIHINNKFKNVFVKITFIYVLNKGTMCIQCNL